METTGVRKSDDISLEIASRFYISSLYFISFFPACHRSAKLPNLRIPALKSVKIREPRFVSFRPQYSWYHVTFENFRCLFILYRKIVGWNCLKHSLNFIGSTIMNEVSEKWNRFYNFYQNFYWFLLHFKNETNVSRICVDTIWTAFCN